MSSSRPGDDGDHLDDDFDRIVAGLELSLPADLQDVRAPVPVDPQPDVFEPRLSDPLSADDDDTEHFVPPEPEPFPELDPATRAAWGVLVGAPIVLLVMTVLSLPWPQWLPGGLVLGFIGAMMFLLARRGNHDRGSDPDQGAVI